MRRHTPATTTVTSLVVLIAIVVGAWLLGRLSPDSSRSDPSSMSTTLGPTPAHPSTVETNIQQLFDTQTTDVEVTGSGIVTRLLSDDSEGDRHQRFIVEVRSGLTVLIAHNIDIAPRLEGVAVGDQLKFHGEYAYSDQGGTIHWTHHDPDGSHEAGWLEWKGQRYG